MNEIMLTVHVLGGPQNHFGVLRADGRIHRITCVAILPDRIYLSVKEHKAK